ncbi:MAG: ribosome maturation factor RimM [Actinomycetota bacterium]
MLLEVGVITKAHGLRGEVIVHLWSDLPDRMKPKSSFLTDDGTLVIETSKPHQGQFIVRFQGIGDRTAAERLRSTVLRAESIDVEGVLWIHELLEASVTTSTGMDLGMVHAVEQNPASDLLVTTKGHLIPLAFVVSHEPNESIVVELPEGFLEV